MLGATIWEGSLRELFLPSLVLAIREPPKLMLRFGEPRRRQRLSSEMRTQHCRDRLLAWRNPFVARDKRVAASARGDHGVDGGIVKHYVIRTLIAICFAGDPYFCQAKASGKAPAELFLPSLMLAS